MNRQAQGWLLVVLGATLLSVSAFSAMYANYVRTGFRPALVTTGAILVALGLAAAFRRRRPGQHAPRVAWLLAAPVFAIVLIAPPALGSYAARRQTTAPPPATAYTGPPAADLTLGEFIGRAYGTSTSLAGRPVRLTGFAVTSGRGWHLTRMRINCCAADALALEVTVEGAPAPPEDSWVRVTGTWVPWKNGIPRDYTPPAIAATEIVRIEPPAEPYEEPT
ncbi:putative repeat protein (TIGR03943 family) [Nonomuraea polychroma]|uniref:Putative repeat protein (TIGR03943 family) n=1 Tax=Nonomuraea polychroma TaxID=46176 RepID=A0A438M6I9_9ACTN|nr:TIGR03943 family protein [Nonomuraea polychroma]RVX41306.1 putative repeat protein (TIGR03943 family) [Nonomuraea polychroma]